MSGETDVQSLAIEADLLIGPSALEAYSRLSYTMWHALAEFVDNSVQSRDNYERIIDEVLRAEGKPLQVDITYNKVARELLVEDNSVGMSHSTLVEALKIAVPTADSRGRSRYGMGMKTAACWLGRKWQVITCEWGSGVEWTATVDVAAIAHHGARVPLTSRPVDTNAHYTKVVVSDLRRNMQARTEDTIRTYLSSMYMFDLNPREDAVVPLRLTYNAVAIETPGETVWDTDLDGTQYLREIPEGTRIGTKSISGYIGVLKKGSRKSGGFSLFQNRRQIQGYPSAWKPRSIFGGVDDEGANNLVAQRLTGVLQLDSAFGVSHTKDAILYEGDEEDQLEKFLLDFSKDYRQRAAERRGIRAGKVLSPEKFRELVDGLRSEFSSNEMRNVVTSAQLPPIDAIISNNKQRVSAIADDDSVTTFPISQELTIKVSIQEVSDYDPYVTISPGAEQGVIYVLINGLHPYYQSLESTDAVEECITQFMYDAVAEYRARELVKGPILPDSVRNLKEALMRVRIHQNDNANFRVQRQAISALITDLHEE